MKKLKKIVLLTWSVLTIASLSMAADFSNDPNVQWVISNSTSSLYIDKNGIEYSPADDTATFYVITNYPNKKMFTVSENTINFTANTIRTRDTIEYYDSGDMKELHDDLGTHKIRPSTWGASIRDVVKGMISRDEKLAAYSEEQEKKKAEADKKAKSEEKKEKVKEVAGSVLGGLGGLF